MALPDTITTAARRARGPSPSCKSSGGSVYQVLFDATNTHIEVWKSTNPGTAAWSEQDSANHINRDVDVLGSVQDGDIIHIVSINSTDDLLKYHRFNMSTDAWDTTNSDDTISDLSGKNAPRSTTIWCAIALRGVTNQELVITASGLTDAVMGTDWQRAVYFYGPKSGTPSWTGPSSIEGGGSINEQMPQCVLGTSNSLHIFYATNDAETQTAGLVLAARTLDSSNNLSTKQSVTLTAAASTYWTNGAISYDDAGTQRIGILAALGNGNNVTPCYATEDGSGDIGAITEGSDIGSPSGDAGDVRTTSVEVGGTWYAIWEPFSGVDQLVYKESTDGGATWGTEQSIETTLAWQYPAAAAFDASTIGISGYQNYTEISLGGGHALLADDVQSTSEVTSPAVGQTHALTSTSVESASQASTPAVGQEHSLTVTSVESASEVSQPTASESHALTATGVESASELTVPAIGQAHALTNPGVESASELTAPVVTQAHALTATGTDSASETSAPAVGQEHALNATSVESTSELTTPTVSEAHALLANDVESVSELTVPAVGQVHALTNNGAESASETSSPAVGQEHALLSTGTDSASEVTSPAVTQVHALTSVSVESASQVSNPVLAEAGHALLADDVESTSEVSSPAVGQAHALTVVPTESASELTAPAVGQTHSLAATSVESASELTAPVLTEGSHALLADDVESASEVTTPAVGQAHVLASVGVESASETDTPVIAQVHSLAANDAESASELTAPAVSEAHSLAANDVESASEVSTPTAAQVHALSVVSVDSVSELTSPSIAQVQALAANDVESASEVSAPILSIVSDHALAPSIRTMTPVVEDRVTIVDSEGRIYTIDNEVRSAAA